MGDECEISRVLLNNNLLGVVKKTLYTSNVTYPNANFSIVDRLIETGDRFGDTFLFIWAVSNVQSGASVHCLEIMNNITESILGLKS